MKRGANSLRSAKRWCAKQNRTAALRASDKGANWQKRKLVEKFERAMGVALKDAEKSITELEESRKVSREMLHEPYTI